MGHIHVSEICLSEQPLPVLRMCQCLKSHLWMERENGFLLLLCLHTQLVLVLLNCHYPNPRICPPSVLLPIPWEGVKRRVVGGHWPETMPAWPLMACATPLSPQRSPMSPGCSPALWLYCRESLG